MIIINITHRNKSQKAKEQTETNQSILNLVSSRKLCLLEFITMDAIQVTTNV